MTAEFAVYIPYVSGVTFDNIFVKAKLGGKTVTGIRGENIMSQATHGNSLTFAHTDSSLDLEITVSGLPVGATYGTLDHGPENVCPERTCTSQWCRAFRRTSRQLAGASYDPTCTSSASKLSATRG